MRDILNLGKRSKVFWVLVGLAPIAVIGLAEVFIGPGLTRITFPVLYLLPISLVTWFAGRYLGLGAAAASTLAWLSSNNGAGGLSAGHPALQYWQVAVGTVLYGALVFLLSALQSEKALARTDALTGAVNRRFFYEVLQREMERSRRYHHLLTIAYLDLDNFKAINDQWGHSTGDKVLRMVVESAQQQLRSTDVLARLNGDEFAVLFPETGQQAAHSAIPKLHAALVQVMHQNAWPVTFSIGVLTCLVPPATVDEPIRLADEVMYSVKRNGKNAIHYAIHPGS